MWSRQGIRLIRRLHCVGCGVKNAVPASVAASGINAPLASSIIRDAPPPPSVRQVLQEKTENLLLKQMSNAQLEALNWKSGPDYISAENKAYMDFKSKVKKNEEICTTCLKSRSGTVTPISVPPQHDFVYSNLKKLKLFYVVDAMDFPLGLPDLDLAMSSPEEYGRKYNNAVFVINRCDLMVNHASQLAKLKHYFMDCVFSKCGIDSDNVVLTSAARGWHLKQLSERFTPQARTENILLGKANSGKTRLAHVLSGIGTQEIAGGVSTWPVPFSTRESRVYTSLPQFRSKKIVDTPSMPFDSDSGTGCYGLLRSKHVRKVGAGVKMVHKTPKYIAPKVSAKSGQVVSVGGLVALEFPPVENAEGKRLPVHVFCNIGGLSHTLFARACRDLQSLSNINTSEMHSLMRMHDEPELELEHKLSFLPRLPSNQLQSLVVEGMGFLQPFLFGDFPLDYKIKVWAPRSINVCTRPEALPYLFT